MPEGYNDASHKATLEKAFEKYMRENADKEILEVKTENLYDYKCNFNTENVEFKVENDDQNKNKCYTFDFGTAGSGIGLNYFLTNNKFTIYF